MIGDDPETADLRLGTSRISAARVAVAGYLFDTGRWDDALADLDALLEPGADVPDYPAASGRGWRR